MAAQPALAQTPQTDTVAAADAPGDMPVEARVHPEQWPEIAFPRVLTEAGEARVQAILARMTVEQKVGQIIQADIASVTPEDVRRYRLGSVLNGGNSGPGGDDLAPAEKWLELADAFYDASMDVAVGEPAIPIVWGTDAVHGHSNIIGSTIFPHNVGLGATRDPELIERIGQVTAVEIRVTGQEWTFAPTVAVPQDYRWGRAYEGYSSDPSLVAAYVGSMIRGLQGPPSTSPILAGPYVAASTKHYLADGGTTDGRDQGDAAISELELRLIHGAPYIPAIENGVATIMTSFSSWNGVKLSAHRGLVTDVLKGRMNFDGMVITDWNAHGQVAGCSNASCPRAVDAGIDMFMAPDSWRMFYDSTLAQVRDGTIAMDRLDDAVARVLRLKERLGLFEMGKPSQRALSGEYELLGAPDHRAVAREAVRKSMVLLKNTGVLPLQPGGRILVAGDAANDIARQSGGWTLSWQGTGLDNDLFPGATSLWSGIEQAATATGGSAQLSEDGTFTQRPDAAIVIFGETPYAEFQGDIATLQLRPELRGPIATMRRLKEQGIPVVAVMITGRPLYVNEALNTADAFVAAWLPGSEGAGVADMLFAGADGAPAFEFQGLLPTAWPATARHGGATLFPFGFGMRYADGPAAWTPLPEDSGVTDDGGDSGVFFERGVPASSWSLTVSQADGTNALRVTTVPAEALDGRVRIAATDHGVQEGARSFAVDAHAQGAAIELSTFDPIDLSRETNGDMLLLTTVRRDAPIARTLSMAVSCDSAPCGEAVPVREFGALALGEWQTVGVLLKCFRATGADMTRITAPFRIATDGAAEISLARVALGSLSEADVIADCPTG
ncbi:glycoside hydrolase family 3 protein [Qipengyuania flava]|uniref:glycoside hydrolase family 3 protein n=1 Tax=Qipengyuania flava TaxID=192812 RepID=UPI001C56218F|nr:glycoside hydrolase family 3 protein [Qipengyuania flava]MBW3169548.1 exo 1,3/1,4-beta-D-glucan glucohydrolase [Qipengyuania flava]MBY5966786.1 exo 1,3/1,4-beta-D-glucan glucohydrolase [Qipengyuania flava]MBY6013110.1 exo 1,3/1,4-beta-D-glucan glucohydrolase [Qipengyuania flava]MBY6027552.1 exo 1,3/1,4-beta-D-glucan glucohydrolase [Qipengyuania flava]